MQALEKARNYVSQGGDTLETIAARESQLGNELTAEELAQFNWGTREPEQVEEYMRDRLGCRYRNEDNRYVIADDDQPREALRIPKRFERISLPVNREHTLRVVRRRSPQQFLDCSHIPGVTFDFNSSFLRPGVRQYLRKLELLVERHPDARVMIFGHTDAVGSDGYNKRLSERRAWSAHAFITNDVEAWETLYNHPDEDWGLTAIQEMLTALGHDAGEADGQSGPLTRGAMRSFLGLPEDAPVDNDPGFRRQLFAAYMASEGDIDVPADRFMQPGYMGCGEFNPAEESDGGLEQNRRVTFFLFHKDRLPQLPCAFDDVAPCQRQQVSLDRRHKASFSCSFFDSLARTCPITGKSRELVVLFHVPEEARGRQATLRDWYVLTSDTVPYRGRLQARDAIVVAPNRMALIFTGVPLGGRFTLEHYYDQDSHYTVYAGRSFGELVGHCGGGICVELDLPDDEVEADDEEEFLVDGPDEVLDEDEPEDEEDPYAGEAYYDPADLQQMHEEEE